MGSQHVEDCADFRAKLVVKCEEEAGVAVIEVDLIEMLEVAVMEVLVNIDTLHNGGSLSKDRSV